MIDSYSLCLLDNKFCPKAIGRAKILGDSRAYDFPKNWAQNQTGVVISGNSERISPGVIRSEVGRPEGLWLTTGRPTSECITPGEILSEWPEITTPVWFWPKFLENHTPVNPQKFSRGLPKRGLFLALESREHFFYQEKEASRDEMGWICFAIPSWAVHCGRRRDGLGLAVGSKGHFRP